MVQTTKSFVLNLLWISSSHHHQTVLSFTITSLIPKPHHDRTTHYPRLPKLYQSTETNNANTKYDGLDQEKDDGISDLDARVLQSLLDDKELDLKSEESLKKMLESKEKEKKDVKNKSSSSNKSKDSKSEFSSTVFKVRRQGNIKWYTSVEFFIFLNVNLISTFIYTSLWG